jgi:hypothetical protein
MDRVVFCNSEEFIDEAVKLANEWMLPIQIGDSGRTENLDFDRTKVSVIQIPIYNGFGDFPEVVEPMKPIVLHYHNDYSDCSQLEFFLSTENSMMTKTTKMNVVVNDIHHVSIPLLMGVAGYYSVSVRNETDEISKIHFAASNGDVEEITSYD